MSPNNADNQVEIGIPKDQYLLLFESAADAILLISENRFIDCNPSTLKMFSCSREQIINQTPDKFSPPYQPDGNPSKEKADFYIQEALNGNPQLFEWTYRKADGTEFYAEVHLNSVVLGGKLHILANIRDITTRKQNELTHNHFQHQLEKVLEQRNLELTETNRRLLKEIEEREKVEKKLEALVKEGTWTFIRTNQELDKTIERHVSIDQALVESEEKFRSFIEQSQDGICLLNENGRVIEWNPAMEKITGISAEDKTESKVYQLLTSVFCKESEEMNEEIIRETIRNAIKTGDAPFFGNLIEHKMKRSDREERFIQEKIFPIETSRGFMLGIIVRDVTEHVLTEQAIQESERQFRKILADVELAAVVLDNHGKIKFCNNHLLNLTGWSLKEILGGNWFDIFVKPGQGVQEMFERAIETGDLPPHFENRIVTRNGVERLISWRNTILRDTDGIIIGTTSIGEDVTERRQVQNALIESENRYRQVVEQSPLFIAIEVNGKVKFINSAGASLLGAEDPNDVHGKSILDFIKPDSGKALIEHFQKLIKGSSPLSFIEFKVNFLDGRSRDLEISTLITKPNDELSIQVIAVDITERKQVEKALAHQALLAEIELTINEPLELQDALDKTIDIAKSSISHSSSAAITLLDPISGNLWVPSMDIDSKIRWHITSEITSKSGISGMIMETQEVFVSQKPDEIKAWLGSQAVKEGIQSFVGIPLLLENEILGVLYVFDLRPYSFSLEDLDFLRSLSNRIALVITRIRIYETLLQARIAAEETARAKSQFLANMSHELRTPLNAVVIITDLLRETELNPIQANYIDSISISADKLLAMIDNVLDFSKIEANKLIIEKIPYDLHQCIEDALSMVSLQASEKGLDLAYEVSDEVPQILIGDSVRLGQILINLLSNAIKFTEKGSVFLTVKPLETMVSTGDTKEIKLKFKIQDTGIGIPPNQVDNLFGVFSQLDGSITRKYGGSGLGLAISRHLVTMMNGEIWVKSSGIPGEGSVFYFVIRNSYQDGERSPYLEPNQPILVGKKVLLICSREKTRWVLANQLSFWGMVVYSYHNLAEANASLESFINLDMVLFSSEIEKTDIERSLKKKVRPWNFFSLLWMKILSSGHQVIINDTRQIAGYVEIPVKPRLLYDLLAGIFAENTQTSSMEKMELSDQSSSDLRMLLAEDDPTNREVILLMLEKMGYQATWVSSGLEVIEVMETQDFDVIIMDLQMPDMDGLTATQYIRTSLPKSRQPQIIALTADSRQETLEASLETGVDLFLTKPIRKNVLEQFFEQIKTGENIKLSMSQKILDEIESGKSTVSSIDDSILNDLIETLGNDGQNTLKDLISTFLVNTPSIVEDIQLSAERGDYKFFARKAHALKGNCELFGASRLADLCTEAENLAREGKGKNIIKAAKMIETEYHLVKKVLEEKKSSSKKEC